MLVYVKLLKKVKKFQQVNMSGHELKDNIVYPSIGKNIALMKVNCKIDLKSPAYHYSSQQHPIIQPMSMTHNQNVCILSEMNKNSARSERKSFKSVYLPKALEQQDPSIYKNYLEMLKNNKIESYIKFNIPLQQQQKSKRMLFTILGKLVEKQYRKFFYQFKKYRGKQYFFQQKSDGYQILKNRKSRSHFTQYVDNQDDSPIKITYERVIINNQEQSQYKKSSHFKHHSSAKHHTHNRHTQSSLSKKHLKNKIIHQQNSYTNFIKQNDEIENYKQDQLYTVQRKKNINYKSFIEQSTNNHKKDKKLSVSSNYNTNNKQIDLDVDDEYNEQTQNLYRKLKTSRNRGHKNCENCKYCLQKKNYAIISKQEHQDLEY